MHVEECLVRCLVPMVFLGVCRAQSVPDPGNTAHAAMAVSLEMQRVAITKQVDALIGRPATPAASFFTVPWIDFPSFVLPPCDVLPDDQLINWSATAPRSRASNPI